MQNPGQLVPKGQGKPPCLCTWNAHVIGWDQRVISVKAIMANFEGTSLFLQLQRSLAPGYTLILTKQLSSLPKARHLSLLGLACSSNTNSCAPVRGCQI